MSTPLLCLHDLFQGELWNLTFAQSGNPQQFTYTQVSPVKTSYQHAGLLLYAVRAACPAKLMLLDVIIPILAIFFS
jgi:hypothetical protein